jgi:NAD(P)-dependent dehydrogenase (short-subunit alcohol dehydrogenase family)
MPMNKLDEQTLKNAKPLKGTYALVLGCSSGFGAAVTKKLASQGMNILGVHMDRKPTMPLAEEVYKFVAAQGVKSKFWNVNAADAENIIQISAEISQILKSENNHVRVLLHSLAFGALKPFIADKKEEQITKAQIEMTTDVMGNSLVYWTQELYHGDCFTNGSRIYGLTSGATDRSWPSYGAVSSAKATLESNIRTLSLELGPKGITANTLRCGVTNTPSQKKIPGAEEMQERARNVNPHHRLTTPEDVAEALWTLAQPATYWMSGNIICVDGGEYFVA